MFFRSRLLRVMKKSSDNYHASPDGLFSPSNLEAGLEWRRETEGERKRKTQGEREGFEELSRL